MIDNYWSEVCCEDIELNKMFSHQPDRKIVRKATVGELATYIVRKIDHLEKDKRCDASASSVSDLLNQYIGRDFVNRDGKYMKRVNRELREIGFINIKGHVNAMSQLVNKGIMTADPIEFAFTDKLNWCDGDYGDGGSCFWSCHSHNRDMLEAAGHGAILYYKGGEGVARAWAIKTEYENKNYLGMTNFYNRYTSLRKMDMSYAVEQRFKLQSRVQRLTSNIYMNGDSVLLGKTLPMNGDSIWVDIEAIRGGKYDRESGDGSAQCCRCGDYDHEDNMYYVQGDQLCEDCVASETLYCRVCGDRYYSDNMQYYDCIIVNHDDHVGGDICDDCIDHYTECSNCDTLVQNDMIEYVDYEYFCPKCGEERRLQIEEEKNGSE